MADTNAKTIQDLNQTTAVSGDDLVVVAQSGATEATKATVSTLAEAVGELNSTGALSELSLATSIGKNLLAQNLTNKGVPTDPSETLVQMADKLRGLQTTTDASYLIGRPAIASSSQSNSYYTPIKLARTHRTILVLNSTIYLVPNGSYTSISSMISAAVASYTPTTGSYMQDSGGRFMYGVSQDETKLVVLKAGSYSSSSVTNAVIEVLDISSTSITLLHEISDPFTSSYYSSMWQQYCDMLGVDNSGRYVAWSDTVESSALDTAKLVVYDTQTSEKYTYVISGLTPASSVNYYNRISTIKFHERYISMAVISTNGSWAVLLALEYSVEDNGTITFAAEHRTTQLNMTAATTPIQCMPVSNSDSFVYLYLKNTVAVSENPNYYTGIWTATLIPIAELVSGDATVYSYNITVHCPDSQFSSSYYNMYLLADICTANKNGSTYTIASVLWNDTLILDTSSKTTYTSKGSLLCNIPAFVSGTRIGSYIMVVSMDSAGIALVCATQNRSNSMFTPYTAATYSVTVYDKQCLIGHVRKQNNYTDYYIAYITSERILAGAYDLETSVVPLPEDTTN